MASQITDNLTVHSTACSGNITVTSQWVQRHLKSPMSWLFAEPFGQAQINENINAPCHWPLWGGMHQWPLDSPQKGPVTRKMFPFNDVIMKQEWQHQHSPLRALWISLTINQRCRKYFHVMTLSHGNCAYLKGQSKTLHVSWQYYLSRSWWCIHISCIQLWHILCAYTSYPSLIPFTNFHYHLLSAFNFLSSHNRRLLMSLSALRKHFCGAHDIPMWKFDPSH